MMEGTQRIFVILGHTAAITPEFTLDDLPGSAGRLDILCRCVTAAFCLSHGIRKDVEVYLVLRDQITLHVEGTSLRRLNPDERSTGALIQHALQALQEGRTQSTPGLRVCRQGLRDVLRELNTQGVPCYVLDERGRDMRTVSIEEPVAFLLSDHQNFTPEEEALLSSLPKISLGPVVLHADHSIVIAHNELDRRALRFGSDCRKISLLMAEPKGKPVRESWVEMVQVVRPGDANPLGIAFGGTVVAWMDMAAAVAAMRHARKPVVTASIDNLSFLSPIRVGELAIIRSAVHYTGRTSMEVGVWIESENPITGERKPTTHGYLTFVALDEHGRPTPVPPVIPETPEEKQRYNEAKRRREYKLRLREEQG